MSPKIARRDFFILAGSSIAGLGSLSPKGLLAQDLAMGSDRPRILALFSYYEGIYYYEPAGLYIQAGQTVQWAGLQRRSVTAFHPSINNHELRIPEGAKPFDSRAMGLDDGTFQWTFEVEGTYDYYSQPHEYLGMVGRIVVGKPGGPGEQPPGYGNRNGRAVMYPDARRLLEYLKSDEIVQKKRVPCPPKLLQRPFPWRSY